jgi:hypothetical protein
VGPPRARVFAQTTHRLEHGRGQDHTGANPEIRAATRRAAARTATRPAAAAFGSHNLGWFGHHRRMSARSEQIVLDFLSRTADAAHGTLRSDDRVRFIARLRASIEQQRQAAGAVEPAEVRQILAGFGDPRVLVERELRRLDEARAAAAAGNGTTAAGPARRPGGPGGAAAAAGPAEVRLSGAGRRTHGNGAARRGAARKSAMVWRSVAQGAVADGATADGAVDGAVVRGAVAPGAAGQRHAAGRAPAQAPFDPVAVARRYAREVLALLLLGIGGLLLPVPLWLIGAAIGLTSRVWGRADKFIAVAGPLIVTVAGVGVIGALNKNPSIPVDLHAYVAAAHAYASLFLRIGAALSAAYLAARLARRGAGLPSRSADWRRDRIGRR